MPTIKTPASADTTSATVSGAIIQQAAKKIRRSKVVPLVQEQLDTFGLELTRVELQPNEALFVKAPSGTPLDRLKMIANAIAYICGENRRFVLITDDLEFSIIRDDTSMIAAWHGGPEV